MKNLIFLACALCAVSAVPVPSAEKPTNELELLQIPLEGNKVCIIIQLCIYLCFFLKMHLHACNRLYSILKLYNIPSA